MYRQYSKKNTEKGEKGGQRKILRSLYIARSNSMQCNAMGLDGEIHSQTKIPNLLAS